jgi:hypothetical protein
LVKRCPIFPCFAQKRKNLHSSTSRAWRDDCN